VGANLIHPSVTEESPKHFYSIIDSTHALAHLDLTLAKEIAAEFPDDIVDFAPVLPSFKVHENVDISSLCPAGAEGLDKDIELYVVFFPQGEEDLVSLRTEVTASSLTTEARTVRSPFRFTEKDLYTLAVHDSSTLTVQAYCPDLEAVVRHFTARSDVQWLEVMWLHVYVYVTDCATMLQSILCTKRRNESNCFSHVPHLLATHV
jgi:hypothetical protein